MADNLGARKTGTLTGSSSTSFTAANYPYRTNRSNVGTSEWEGAEVYFTSGTAPVPNPNGVGSYAPTTGVFTPSNNFSTTPASNATFDLYLYGISITDIKLAVNKALRELRYQYLCPLSLVTDADMSATGTTDWTASNATLSKVSGATTLIRGSQSLRVVATAASAYARSGIIYTSPGAKGGAEYYVHAYARANVGTARLIVYNESTGANIATEDYTADGWGIIDFQATIPSTAEQVSIRLMSVANNDDTDWGNVIFLRAGQRETPLPSWVTRPEMVRQVYTPRPEFDLPDDFRPIPKEWWSVIPDEGNPNNQFRLATQPVTRGPIWFWGSRPFTDLSADSDTTFADRTWITTAATMHLLDMLRSAPNQDKEHWDSLYREWRAKLVQQNRRRYPQPRLDRHVEEGFI